MAKTNTNARTLPGANMDQSSAKIRTILQSLSAMLGKYSVDKVKGLMDSIVELMDDDDDESIGNQLTNAINAKVDKTDYATASKAGIVTLKSNGGLKIEDNGELSINALSNSGLSIGSSGLLVNPATQEEVNNGSNVKNPVTPNTLKVVTNTINANVTNVSGRVTALEEINSNNDTEVSAIGSNYYGISNGDVVSVLGKTAAITKSQIYFIPESNVKYSKSSGVATASMNVLMPCLIGISENISSLTIMDSTGASVRITHDFQKDVNYLIAKIDDVWDIAAEWHNNELGNHWNSGTVINHTGNTKDYSYEGSIGDMYLNIQTLGVYRCGGRKENGSYEWLYVGSWTKNSLIGYDNLDESLKKMIDSAMSNSGSNGSISGVPDSVNENILELQDDVKVIGLKSNLPYAKGLSTYLGQQISSGVEVDTDITIPDDVTPLSLDDKSDIAVLSDDTATQADTSIPLVVNIGSFKIHGVPDVGTNGTCGTISVPSTRSTVTAPTSGTFTVNKYYTVTDTITYTISNRSVSHSISIDLVNTTSYPDIETSGAFSVSSTQIVFKFCVGWVKLVEKSSTKSWTGKYLSRTYYTFEKINYSEKPMRIGTWIDGTPVWRQAFQHKFTADEISDIKTNNVYALNNLLSVTNPGFVYIINHSATFGMFIDTPCVIDDIILSPTNTLDEVAIKYSWFSGNSSAIPGIYGYIDFVAPTAYIRN